MKIIKRKEAIVEATEMSLVESIGYHRRRLKRMELTEQYRALLEKRPSILRHQRYARGRDTQIHPDALKAVDYSTITRRNEDGTETEIEVANFKEWWTDTYDIKLFVGEVQVRLENAGFEVEVEKR